MDLTVEVDRIDDAVLDETGTYVASFILEGEILGEIEFPVYVQAAAQKLPKETEEGLRKSDVIWVGTRANGHKRMAPVWFAYKDGKIYVLSSRDPDLQEQSVPGVPDAQELVVVTRRKGRDTSLEEFTAAQRLLEGPRVGERREDARGPAAEPRRPADGFALPMARQGRHRRAHAERGSLRLTDVLGRPDRSGPAVIPDGSEPVAPMGRRRDCSDRVSP